MKIFYKIYFALKKRAQHEQFERLKRSFKYCGSDVYIDSQCHIIYPTMFELGDRSSISSFTTIYATYGVKIGKNCLISSNCGISSYNHVIESKNRKDDSWKDEQYSKPVVIGDNVWIGMNACVLPGVTIGDNSIIGSGSVVTKNVPENEIWVGNPARFVRKLS